MGIFRNFHFSMIFENFNEVNFMKEIVSINEVKEESSLILI